jgi:D-xylose transport system ATP-binding protein
LAEAAVESRADMETEPQSARRLMEMQAISKSFPGVRALDHVNFDVHSGEIHALVGENGAGKSTLMKILGGVYSQYDGDIKIDGEPRRFQNVHESQAAGIAIVFQELSLVREMTVGENICLGREPGRFGVVDWHELYGRASQALKSIGLQVDPRKRVATLGAGAEQLVEIAKALSHDARILVLDEPTAALTGSEAESLFSVLMQLRARGLAIAYISHRLEEVFRLSDRVTVLRDGRTVGTSATAATNQSEVIARMVGREVSQLYPSAPRNPGSVRLQVRNLHALHPDHPGRPLLNDISFDVRSGEVLGIAGLIGAGRTELLNALFGALPVKCAGKFVIDGKPVMIRKPADAIARGIGLVTEDRKGSGLMLDQTILANMTLAALRSISGTVFTNEARAISASKPLFRGLRIKANSLFAVAGTLSGGNQQKVVLGKWLMNHPKILLLDEPTRGIDIGAKQEIYAEIDRLAKSGMAVVMVSSEMPEIIGLSDRILVMHQGRVAGRFTRQTASPAAIMECATGLSSVTRNGVDEYRN